MGPLVIADLSLSVLSLPEGLKQIDNLAFKNCVSLKNVHLPSTIEVVKDGAFEGCPYSNK